MQTSFDRWIGRAAFAATVVIVITALATGAAAFTRPGRALLKADRLKELLRAHSNPAAFKVGAASHLPAAWHEGADYTVVIFGRSSCPACASSMPFFRQTTTAALTRGMHVVAANTSRSESTDGFAQSISAASAASGPAAGAAKISAVRANPLPDGLRRVPLVLVVDRTGVVRAMQEGAPSTSEQRAFENLLAALK